LDTGFSYTLKQEIANIIKEKRHAAGLSQENLALKAGISTRFYQDIEGGIKQPSIETLFKLSAGLDCHYSDILEPIWKHWQTN